MWILWTKFKHPAMKWHWSAKFQRWKKLWECHTRNAGIALIGELFAVWCDLWTIISVSGAKAPLSCAAIQKPRCDATVCIQRKSLYIGLHFDVRKSASNVLLYMKDLQMCITARILDMRPYFIIHSQWLKLNVDFRGKKRTVVQDPLLPSVRCVRFHKCR